MGIENICRTCRAENQELLFPLHKRPLGNGKSLMEMLANITSTKINAHDGGPQCVCQKCSDNIKQFFYFKKECDDSEIIIQGMLRELEEEKPVVQTKRILQVKQNKVAKKRLSQNFEIIILEPSATPPSEELTEDSVPVSIIEPKEETSEEIEQIVEFQEIEEEDDDEKGTFVLEDESIEQLDPKGSPEYFACDECQRFFKSAEHLSAHKSADHLPNKCYKCGVSFESFEFLKEHLIDEHKLRNHCDICQKGYRTKRYLSEHMMRQHAEDKPFGCEICDKSFTTGWALKQHTLLHNTEKQYQCKYCERKFCYRKSVREHENTHTGNKPYKCDICGVGFAASANVIQHRRTHTGEMPYTCRFCNKAFVFHNMWTLHENKHHKEFKK